MTTPWAPELLQQSLPQKRLHPLNRCNFYTFLNLIIIFLALIFSVLISLVLVFLKNPRQPVNPACINAARLRLCQPSVTSPASPVQSVVQQLSVTPSRPRPPGSSPPGYFPDTPRPIPVVVAVAVAFQTFQAFQSSKLSKLSRLSKPPRLPKSIQGFQAF